MLEIAGPAAQPHRIAMFVYPGIAPLDLTGPMEVFAAANFIAKSKLYELSAVAEDPGPIATALGFSITPCCTLGNLALPLGTVLVCGGSGADAAVTPPALGWIKHAGSGAGRYGSICTGAFVLAAAGLLDGRSATTHWAFCAALAARYPQVRVEANRIYVRDGRLITSGGITAGIDLALALVEEDRGRRFAGEVARLLVVSSRRNSHEPQLAGEFQAASADDHAIAVVQDHCKANLAGDLSVATLAGLARMSERNFARLFLKETGLTPARYVTSLRVKAACSLLQASEHEAKAVASRCGFTSSELMRRTFIQHLGVSPAKFRKELTG